MNRATMIHLRLKAARERSVQDHIADTITSFSGRMGFGSNLHRIADRSMS